jgi:serine/threonine protein kinase
MIVFNCPHCGLRLGVKEEFAGKKARCQRCSQVCDVPQAAAVASVAAVPESSSGEVADLHTVLPSAAGVAPGDGQESLPPVNHAVARPRVDPDHLLDFLAPSQEPGEIGRLGNYRVLKVLGVGGMGVVFHAEDVHLKRPVALKAMLPVLSVSPTVRQRFIQEAQAAAAIQDDHVVTIYQVSEDRGIPFLAMQLLQGETLETRLKRQKRLPVSMIVRLGREIAAGLAAAHAKNLIHRDVKPANVWLEAGRDRVKLLDFGLVRAAAGDMNLTQSGAIIGTPGYLAPEQAKGQAVDARSDLFGLGCVLYRMCTGEPPFKGTDTLAVLAALATETPRSVVDLNPQVPLRLSELIMQLLAKNASERPPSARKVIERLVAIERGLQESGPATSPVSSAEASRLVSERQPPPRRVAERPAPVSAPAAVSAEVDDATLVEGVGGAKLRLLPPPQAGRSKLMLPLLIGAGALAGFCLLGAAALGWHFLGGHGGAVPTSAAAKPTVKEAQWLVIFRSDDPSIWNTTSKGENKFAMPLEQVPATIRYLRLKRLDNGEVLILPITRGQLDAKSAPTKLQTSWWNGTNQKDGGNYHLGIAQAPIHPFPNGGGIIAVQMEGWDAYTGSGFGHKYGADKEGLCCCWRGYQIPKTAFEIAVTSDPLSPEEERFLLNK